MTPRTMNPRLLIATPLYPPDIGGPATYTTLLERELPAYGVTVDVVAFAASRHYPKIIRHFHYFWRVLKALRHSDIVFAQDILSVGLPTVLAALLLGRPVLVRVPGDYAWEQSVQRYGVTDTIDEFQTKRYGLRVELLRWLQQRVVKNATRVITPSDYFNRLVTAWGLPAKQVQTIYNGVDFNGEVTRLAKPEQPTMVTAGRLVAWKGIDLLIDTLSELPEWQLVILGDGPLRSELEAKAQTLGVADRVRFLGIVDRSEVLGWCAVADAFVLNTSFESFSFQTVEALQSGVPVITTNVGSLPELITNGVEGVLLEPNDRAGFVAAITSIKADPAVWHTRTAAATVKAQQFSITATTESVAALIKTVVTA